MSEFICFLITFARTVKYDPEAGQTSELIKVALKVHRDDLPRADAGEYPRECEASLRLMLPLHCRDLGPIVDIERIFEVEDISPQASAYITYVDNHITQQVEVYVNRPGASKGLAINHDHPIYEQLLKLRDVDVLKRVDPNQWRPYEEHDDKIEKQFYDVRGEKIYRHFWPNAGQMNHAHSSMIVRPGDGMMIRPSPDHPMDLREKPPGPASPPPPKPASEPPGKIMVLHERAPTCYWHAGCACFPSPPMTPGSKRCPCHIQLKCTHCGRVALKPRNQSGMVLCDEVD